MWEVKHPVNFINGGDFTRQAIAKFISEILAIYGHLNALRKFSVSAAPPTDAGDYDMWLDPSTMELKTYFGNHPDKWVCVVRAQSATMSDMARTAEESQDSGRLGGYPASYYATAAEMGQALDLLEEVVLNPPESRVPVFKGPWIDGGGYEPLDAVEYQGSSYVLLEGDGLAPPPDHPWQLIALAGRDFTMSILDGGRADSQFAAFVSGGAA